MGEKVGCPRSSSGTVAEPGEESPGLRPMLTPLALLSAPSLIPVPHSVLPVQTETGSFPVFE